MYEGQILSEGCWNRSGIVRRLLEQIRYCQKMSERMKHCQWMDGIKEVDQKCKALLVVVVVVVLVDEFMS